MTQRVPGEGSQNVTMEEASLLDRARRGDPTAVEALLSSTVGEGYDASPNRQPLCKCTEYSHDEVIAAIKQNELRICGQGPHYLNPAPLAPRQRMGFIASQVADLQFTKKILDPLLGLLL